MKINIVNFFINEYTCIIFQECSQKTVLKFMFTRLSE